MSFFRQRPFSHSHRISKPVLLIMLQQGICPWHLPPLKWETVSKWLGCRHQEECNLHSQIAPSVSRTAPEIYTKLASNASIAQQLIRCNHVGFKGWYAFWRLFEGRCLRKVASSLRVCCVLNIIRGQHFSLFGPNYQQRDLRLFFEQNPHQVGFVAHHIHLCFQPGCLDESQLAPHARL